MMTYMLSKKNLYNTPMNTKRNIVIIIFIITAVATAWLLFKNQKAVSLPSTTATTTLTFRGAGLTFSYPKELTAYKQDDNVVLHHEIPYQNTGACDMEGDSVVYPMFTDFHVTMRIVNSPLVQTVKSLSPYIPEENFAHDVLKVNPGFIDSFESGAFKGFVIYEGAEGCGVITHYLPIPGNKTLVVQKASIQALSGVRGQEEIQNILRVPGAIAPSVSDRIFMEILRSLTLTP